MTCFTHYPAPFGPLCLVSDGTALTGLWMHTENFDTSGLEERSDLSVFREAGKWLDGYFRGCPGEITFPLSPAGTAFQRQVWENLLTIPYGGTTSYGAIAKQLGPNMSAQAVGQAVGRNPISILIPCHRVVGARGQLTGYAGGLPIKKWLLQHEQCAHPTKGDPE